MKQERFGSKIQNWHRPLWPDELKHSYRRDKDSWDIADEAYDSRTYSLQMFMQRVKLAAEAGRAAQKKTVAIHLAP